jgi:hypothetical protein
MNSSSATSKLHSSAGIFGELGELTSEFWLRQNSSAKPLDLPSKLAGASGAVAVTTFVPLVDDSLERLSGGPEEPAAAATSSKAVKVRAIGAGLIGDLL